MTLLKKSLPTVMVLLTLALLTIAAEAGSALGWSDFSAYFDFWSKTLGLGILFGVLLGMAGFWMVSQQTLYSGLAISSTSVLGLLLTTGLLQILQIGVTSSWLSLGAIIFGVGIYLLANKLFQNVLTQDALTATLYITTTGGTVLLSNVISQGHHEMENLIFGNSVTVLAEDFRISLIVGLGLLLLGFLYARRWLLLVFDEVFLQVTRRGIALQQTGLNLFIALSLIFAAKLFGMFTVFAIVLFAPLSAWKQSPSGLACHRLAAFYGACIFPAGFILSFFLDLPTGASICLTGFVIFLVSLIGKKIGK